MLAGCAPCVWWGVAAAQHLVCQAWLGNKVGRALAFPAVEAMLTAARSDAHRPHWGGLETIKLTAHKMPETNRTNKNKCQKANIKSYWISISVFIAFLYCLYFED